ncbi:unnamed protein product, partial [Onchocerca ochengi]|uniref:S ribonuclease n=1 Tax=Onchocerca ochengi TaxID=42157 RepID=A0A182EXL2_ONCOC
MKGYNHGKKDLTVKPKKANKPEIWTCLSLKYSNLQMNKVKSTNHEVKEPRKDLKIQDLELKSVLVIQLGRNRNSTSSSVSARNKFQRQFWLEDGAIVQISVEATVLESERALGVEILTLHVSGGTKMLKEALNVVKDTKIELIGVTVLTSMSNKDLSKLGIARRTKSQVNRRKSNLNRRTHGAEAMKRFIANQIKEERISTNERKRQRMAQISIEKAAKRRTDLTMLGCDHEDRILQLQICFVKF